VFYHKVVTGCIIYTERVHKQDSILASKQGVKLNSLQRYLLVNLLVTSV